MLLRWWTRTGAQHGIQKNSPLILTRWLPYLHHYHMDVIYGKSEVGS